MQKIGIGLAGLGNVGTGVFKHLTANRALLMERLGLELSLRKVAVKDLSKSRMVDIPEAMLTRRWEDLVEDPAIQIVVELIGYPEIALPLIVRAIELGKIVVTGNKALLAEHGKQIFGAAAAAKVPVFFEAAVAGGVPIIKSIREAFIGNHIRSIHGIINGTSNYILTRMTEGELGFDEALREAQDLGFAEADPTLDINGWDAAHKAVILTSLAYGSWIGIDTIHVEGIEKVTAADIRFAQSLGYCIKLLAVIKADEAGQIETEVRPTLVPRSHVLASVNGAFNAIAVTGDLVGETLFYGRGAGQDPTASAVISDIAEAAVAVVTPRRDCGFMPHGLYGSCKAFDEIVSQFYLRLSVEDRPGVLAQVAGILGDQDIGISSVIQPETHEQDSVPLVLMIHYASNGQMNAAVEKLASLECVKKPPRVMRVETFSAP